MIRRAAHHRSKALFAQASIRFEFECGDGVPSRSACEVTDVSARLKELQADPRCVWAAACLEGEVLDGWYRMRSGKAVAGVSDRVVWQLRREGLVPVCPGWVVRSLHRRRFFGVR